MRFHGNFFSCSERYFCDYRYFRWQFVQAVSSNDGEQIWKTKTSSIVWSSPVIHNEKVYIGSGEGVMYCLDLYTGEIINRFQTSESIFSSPVISDSLLFFGSGNGLGVEPSKVDVVLGKNENGLAAAWVKKYDSSKGGLCSNLVRAGRMR